MIKTRSNAMADSGWNASLCFGVLSPMLGILVGFLALLFFYLKTAKGNDGLGKENGGRTIS